MPYKISEKKLVIGIISFLLGLMVLFNTTLFPKPIQVSEIGILQTVFSIALIVLGVRFFRRAIVKM
jgi:hypothetical protein